MIINDNIFFGHDVRPTFSLATTQCRKMQMSRKTGKLFGRLKLVSVSSHGQDPRQFAACLPTDQLRGRGGEAKGPLPFWPVTELASRAKTAGVMTVSPPSPLKRLEEI